MAFDARIGTLEVGIVGNTKGLDSSIDKINAKLKSTEKVVQQSASSWSRLEKAMVAAVSGASVGILAKQVINLSDAATNMSNKMRIATKHTGDFEVTTKRLFDVANETRSSIESTTELYARMERATRDLGLGEAKLLNITETINKSFAIGGNTAQEAAGAIRQFTQALGAGALRGDEFNSVNEQAPVIMEAIRKQTGKNVGELKRMAEQGKLTSDILIKSLLDYKDVIDNEFDSTQKSFSQQLAVARNNAIKFAESSDSMRSAVGSLGKAIVFLSENIDTAIGVASALAVAIGVKMTTAYVNSTIAASSFIMRLNAAAASGTALSGVANTASVAVTRLSGAFSLLGGPLGIAATAMAAFYLSTRDSRTEAEKFSDKVNELSAGLRGVSMDDLNKRNKEASSRYAELSEELNKVKNKMNELKEVGAQFNRSGDLSSEYKELLITYKNLSEQAKEVKAEVAALNKELQSRFSDSLKDEMLRAEEENKKRREELLRQETKTVEEELQRQVAAEMEAERRRKELLEQRIADAQKAKQRLLDAAKSEEQLENERYARELEQLRLLQDNKKIIDDEYRAAKEQAEIEHNERLKQIRADREMAEREEMNRRVELASAMSKGLLAVAEIFGSKSKKQQKRIARANAIVSGIEAAVHAWKQGMKVGGPYAAAAFTAMSLATTKKMIDSINSGGRGGVSASGSAPSASAGGGQSFGGNAGGQQSGQPKNITINMTDGALLSTDQVRQLIGQIGEQLGDGVQLSTSTGG